eukprot:TRINITY_DN2869_c0_g1_i2.p1 TRINITY_DN2869_c0_g1~~TRINITY_DN2869_c0_g1_i2.p1  ORF type:complete len:394 (-),score=68.30 TRINITY_DN2869_c0_g1_i2:266-1447(-)
MRSKIGSFDVCRHNPHEQVIASPTLHESAAVDHNNLKSVHSGLFVHEKKKWLRRWIGDQRKAVKLEDSPTKEHTAYHEDSSDDEAAEKKWLRRWTESQNSTNVNSPKEHGDSSDGEDDDNCWTQIDTRTPRQQVEEAVRPQQRVRGTKRPSPMSALRPVKEEALEHDEQPRKRVKHAEHPHGTFAIKQEKQEEAEDAEESAADLEDNVQRVLATAGVSPDSIIKLINNEEERTAVIRATGFSNNYIMKLQRRVLRSASALQLRHPDLYTISNTEIHVLFDSNDKALFIKKELCELLGMKGTTFSYWKKKSNVEEIDTSKDFRLMDQCRSIFGGRSTYTLYSVDATLAILTKMEASRQKGFYRSVALTELIALTRRYERSPPTTPMEGLDNHSC